MNDMESMRTFADQLWKYMVPKLDSKFASNVSYFRAQVVLNLGNNTLEVQRPVENGTLTLPCVRAMSGAQAGQQVVALVMGSMSNAIVVGDGNLNVPGGGGDAGIANFQAQPDGSLVITLTNGNTFTATPHDPTKQDVLTFDDVPTQGSNNPVKSGGIYTALAGKQDTLTFDDTPTAGSNNPVKSGGIYMALDGKVDKVAGKGLSTNDFTTAEKNKLDGIEAGAEVNQNAFANVKVGTTTVAADAEQDTLELVAGNNITITPDATNDKVTIATTAEVNQNAFSNVKVGRTTVSADSKTDTLELVAGSNITLTANASTDTVTIAATDTTYSSKAAESGGTAVSLVTTGEKYNWNHKQDALTFDSTPAAGSSNPVTSEGIKTALDEKADSSHTHDASDITSGILPAARGGTGNGNGYIQIGQLAGTTLGTKATAEGGENTASAAYCHAEGWGTTASSVHAHAEGKETTASGGSSHAEGYKTVASNSYAHAEGYMTTASGSSSHAEGDRTTASGESSHAEGYLTVASGKYSHAEGRGTTADGDCQHVFGKYNIADTTSVEIVGWGVNNTTKKNIRTLATTGNEWIAGTLTQASDARLKDVQGEIPDLSSIRAVRFRWKNGDDKEHLGYLAQDVEGIAPYLVGVDSNGYKSLDYIALLTAKVEMLEREIEKLKAGS